MGSQSIVHDAAADRRRACAPQPASTTNKKEAISRCFAALMLLSTMVAAWFFSCSEPSAGRTKVCDPPQACVAAVEGSSVLFASPLYLELAPPILRQALSLLLLLCLCMRSLRGGAPPPSRYSGLPRIPGGRLLALATVMSRLGSGRAACAIAPDGDGRVVIPSNVNAIASYGFSPCAGLVSVVIPASVTSVGTC